MEEEFGQWQKRLRVEAEGEACSMNPAPLAWLVVAEGGSDLVRSQGRSRASSTAGVIV